MTEQFWPSLINMNTLWDITTNMKEIRCSIVEARWTMKANDSPLKQFMEKQRTFKTNFCAFNEIPGYSIPYRGEWNSSEVESWTIQSCPFLQPYCLMLSIVLPCLLSGLKYANNLLPNTSHCTHCTFSLECFLAFPCQIPLSQIQQLMPFYPLSFNLHDSLREVFSNNSIYILPKHSLPESHTPLILSDHGG